MVLRNYSIWTAVQGLGKAGGGKVLNALAYDPTTYEMLGLSTGTGDLTVGRDSARYALNSENLYFSVAAYEAVWNGGRNVQNEATYSEDLTNAAWVKTNGTATASIFTATSGNATCLQTLTKAASDRIYACTIGRVTGTGTVEITTDGGTTWVDITSSVAATAKRFTCSKSAETDPEYGVRLVTSGDEVSFTYHQNEDATGRADITIPSEYCPTDTVGAGDPSGYKVFANANGNSVASNVVTEGVGAALAEVPWLSGNPAVTNSQVWSNDLTNAAWFKANAVSTKNATGLDGVPSSGCYLVDDSSGGTGSVNVSDVVDVVSGQSNCAVAYLQADQLTWARVSVTSVDSDFVTFFDLGAGSVGATDTAEASEIVDVGNGYYKCIIQFSSVTDLSGFLRVYVANSNSDLAVDLDGTSSIIVGNVELHKGKTLAEVRGLPIFTEGAAVSTTADDPSLDILNHNNDEVCYYFEWSPGYDYDEKSADQPVLTTSTNPVAMSILRDRFTAGELLTWDGANLASVTGLTYTAGNTLKLGVIASISDASMRVCAEGVWGTAGTYDGYSLDGVLALMNSIYPMRMRNLQRYDIFGSVAQKAKIDELMITRLTADSFTDRLEDESGNYLTV